LGFSMSNHYKEYILETQHCKILETDYGFATYRIEGPLCYIIDVYVHPDQRSQKLSHELADIIVQEAKEMGCNQLLTTVNMSNPQENRENIYAILKYGFNLVRSNEHALYFIKRI